MANEHIFREYDIRGLAETELTSDFVYNLGRAMGRYFQEHGQTEVIVGRDNRLSSDRIFKDLTTGLAAANCAILDLGKVTSPIFYYARIHQGIDSGVMITASHNPAEFNGFKVALGPGTLFGEEIQKIGGYCSEFLQEKRLPGPMPTIKPWNPAIAYENMLLDKIKLGPRRLKVAIDCGNGTASLFAASFFSKLGCDVIPLYCESDGRFPNHHPDPVESENLRDLGEVVRKNGADLGIAFDGDGDRLGIIDENGRPVWGDRYMVLFWREILAKHPGVDCIIEVKCSQSLVEEVKRLGGNPIFYRTGHSLIKAKMREIGALFTGEMSGHMFFADEFYGFDDAFYAAARLLRILSNADKNLSGLLVDVPQYPSTAETRIFCNDTDKFNVVRQLKERLQKQYPVIDVDGVRVLFSDGWGLARCSNTQPVIVARCEGYSTESLHKICVIMKAELESFPEVTPFAWRF